jgi:hypothetical protein
MTSITHARSSGVFIRSCCAVILPLALSVNRKPLVHSGGNLLFTPACDFSGLSRFLVLRLTATPVSVILVNAPRLTCAAEVDETEEKE